MAKRWKETPQETKWQIDTDFINLIETDNVERIELFLKQYPGNKYYPSLRNVMIKSFTMLKLLDKLYGRLDIHWQDNILFIIKNIKTVPEMKDFALFLLKNGEIFLTSSRPVCTISIFCELVKCRHIILATEFLKKDKDVKNVFNTDYDYSNILSIIEHYGPETRDKPYFLNFVEECMKAGLLFKKGTVFECKEIQDIVKRYPKKVTVTQVVEYNC